MNDELRALGEEYWEYRLSVTPTMALLLGDHRFDDRNEEYSRESEDRHIGRLRDFATRAETIDATDLTADEMISRDVLTYEATSEAAVAESRVLELEASHTMGAQAMWPVTIGQIPVAEPEHAEAILDKYVGIGREFDERADRLREGVSAGRTPMGSTAEKTVTQLDAQLSLAVEDDPFVAKLAMPDAWGATETAAFRERLAAVVLVHLRPAIARFRDTIADDVLPVARPDDRPGLRWLADGEETYSRAILRHTTMAMDPREIHEIGLQQIARLADPYRELGSEVLGTSDLSEIFTGLREDDDLHFKDGPAIVRASEQAMAKARAAMGDWFGRLPEAPCVVEETATGATAFYQTPSLDGSRPGTFYVNTAEPSRWSTFEIEAMAYHEGIPGHHLQLTIAQELEGVPQFRQHANVTAYAEGWGLYTERLADEMGLYGGPLDRIGMLEADSTRAGRLVVDTGLHTLGWSRQKAIDFFAENSPMTMTTIEGEVDRYIAWPGQALAYMIGRLEIMRMRAEARTTMGDRFDIKAFHDTVLGSGLVPLETLDRMIREWAS